ncbi:GNAT family N-acetyltransferase [Allorhizocola rhizosphaerae]|uniref:GNAT family N-acetyltransferase n=1 Tax=Allorhizocola rhizosphaerae TaxID=1872709 RepID=UPI000E3EAFE6|nr:GNAT family N-acetyltransferase [Allorhizocola rhizosphaerae]
MRVRDARPSDNDALVALAAQCPMDGDLSLCIDRSPDFFALHRLGGQSWRVGVIDGDDGPIACVGVARRPAFVDGRSADVGYIGDLKVHPAHRRRGTARALAQWAVAAAGSGPLIATVLAGNTAVDASRLGFSVTRWTTIRSHSINLLWRRRIPRSALTVRPGGADDVPEMVALWGRLAASRQFAPVHESFPLNVPGLDYLLAHRPDGKLAGFVGLWDQHAIKQMRVTGYSPRLAGARVAFNLAAPLFGAPCLPRSGGALSYRTVVNPCAADAATLRTLLVHGCNGLRGRYSFVTIGLDSRDPLSRALTGMLAQPTDVDLLVLDGPTDRTAPVHFEISTV